MLRLQRYFLLFGISFLFTHEMDAMTQQEWLVLPLTSWLEPDLGRYVFVLAHIPIFALVIGLLSSLNERYRLRTERVLAGFLVIHAGLHMLFANHPNYFFNNWLSQLLIFGAAAFGGAYWLLVWRFSRTK